MLFFLRLAVKTLFTFLFRLEVEGLDHIPKEGPVLLYANHQSNWDPPLIGSVVSRRIHFMAKDNLFRQPLMAGLFRWLGAFPVKRGAADRRAVRQALQILQDGQILLVFPEGSRSKTGKLGKFFSGAALFAVKSDATPIPITICGNYKLFRKIKVIISPPIHLFDYKTETIRAEHLAKTIQHMMEPIQQNLSQCQESTSM